MPHKVTTFIDWVIVLVAAVLFFEDMYRGSIISVSDFGTPMVKEWQFF